MLSGQALKHFGMGKRAMYGSLWIEAGEMMKSLKDRHEEGPCFDPEEYVERAIINVIATLVFGDRFEYQDPRFHAIMEALKTDAFTYENLIVRLLFEYGGLLNIIPRNVLRMSSEVDMIFKFFDFIDDALEREVDENNPNSVIDLLILERKANPDGQFSKKTYVGAVVADLFGYVPCQPLLSFTRVSLAPERTLLRTR